MKIVPKHLLGLAIIAAFSPALVTTSYAQLRLEIAKAPESAPKIAIIPFSGDQAIYPVVEQDLNRSGRFSSASKNLPATASLNNVNAEAWKAAGVPYVVLGETKPNADGSLVVQYQL